MPEFIGGLFAFVFFVVWIGVVIFFIRLALRLVKAVEKIADKMEKTYTILSLLFRDYTT